MGGGKCPGHSTSTFELFSEFDSNRVWKDHNGCTGTYSHTNVDASYHKDGYPSNPFQGSAMHVTWSGCPATAPVEYFQIFGMDHVREKGLEGKDVYAVIFDFFSRVERAL